MAHHFVGSGSDVEVGAEGAIDPEREGPAEGMNHDADAEHHGHSREEGSHHGSGPVQGSLQVFRTEAQQYSIKSGRRAGGQPGQ